MTIPILLMIFKMHFLQHLSSGSLRFRTLVAEGRPDGVFERDENLDFSLEKCVSGAQEAVVLKCTSYTIISIICNFSAKSVYSVLTPLVYIAYFYDGQIYVIC